MNVLNNLSSNPEQRLRTVFKLINEEKPDARANTQELKRFAWKSMVSIDSDQIRKVVVLLSYSNNAQFALYSDKDIIQSIEQTLLY